LPQSHRPAPTPQVVLDINGERVVVRDLPVTLGRGSNADITVEDTGVSRRHLDIVEQDGTYLAVDLGSTNGSYLDGKRLHGRAELRNGSVIEMGRARIVFRLMVRKG
ncbi:FHA domain-containing protein, partial [Rothia nasimurium]